MNLTMKNFNRKKRTETFDKDYIISEQISTLYDAMTAIEHCWQNECIEELRYQEIMCILGIEMNHAFTGDHIKKEAE